jgi:hypothetical protein
MNVGHFWHTRAMDRKPYPSDVSNEAWAFVAPYLSLMRLEAPQRVHGLREVFNPDGRETRATRPYAPARGAPRPGLSLSGELGPGAVRLCAHAISGSG